MQEFEKVFNPIIEKQGLAFNKYIAVKQWLSSALIKEKIALLEGLKSQIVEELKRSNDIVKMKIDNEKDKFYYGSEQAFSHIRNILQTEIDRLRAEL